MKPNKSSALVTVKPEVARAFLPATLHKNGEIDLGSLAKLARNAIDGSDQSLTKAQEILDGGWWATWFQSGEMQKHVIQSITHIRDISKVNLALSAICNDLAAANSVQAKRIDANHHATNAGLHEVKALTGELLEHLRRPREPSLIDRLFPAMSAGDGASHDAIRSWLRELSEAIDQQYIALQHNVDVLTKRAEAWDGWVDGIDTQLGSLDLSLKAALKAQEDDTLRQLGLMSGRLNQVDSTVRRSHDVLGGGLQQLDAHLRTQVDSLQRAIDAEAASRSAMTQSLIAIVKERERAIRGTITASNQHLLKRMMWTAGAILILQVAVFGFLSIKMGLWS